MTTNPTPKAKPARGSGRALILAAAMDLIRQKGFAAMSVDELCAAAGITKGAFFHHFRSKDDLGVAAVLHWSEITGAMFAAASYHQLSNPLDRVLGYLDLRASLLGDEIAAFSCVAGTAVQELHLSHPDIRKASGVAIAGGAGHVFAPLEQALQSAPRNDAPSESLAYFIQVAIQGGIVVAKSQNDARFAREAIEHVRRYLLMLFGRTTSA